MPTSTLRCTTVAVNGATNAVSFCASRAVADARFRIADLRRCAVDLRPRRLHLRVGDIQLRAGRIELRPGQALRVHQRLGAREVGLRL